MTVYKYIPASQTNPGFDALGNPLTNPAVVGHNGAETEVNYSPVDNSWPEQYSIPGADLPNYTFDGDSGDVEIGNVTDHGMFFVANEELTKNESHPLSEIEKHPLRNVK